MQLSDFFSHGQSPVQLAIFIAVFLLCWNLENLFGVSENYRRWRHDRANFWFILPGGLSQLLLGGLFAKGLLFAREHHLGLLERWQVGSVLGQLVVAFVIWDLFYYLYHVAMHKFKAVWRFHAVHHSDPILNVSTSLREHPAETFIRLGSYMAVSCLMAPAVWMVGLHQFVQVVSKIIIHSNWRLPERVDKYLSLVLLTPNMHHVHHHDAQPCTDSNYGDLFSIWDRMFGTYRHLPVEKVRFGLDTVPLETFSLDFKNLLKLPFNKKFRQAQPAKEVFSPVAAAENPGERPLKSFLKKFRVPFFLLLCAVSGLHFMSLSAPEKRENTSGDLVFHLSGLTPNRGCARVVLYDKPDQFLSQFGFCTDGSVEVGASGEAEIVLHGLPFGKYAGTFYQDENHNSVIDRNWSGIPTEPYAFSNGVRAKWRVPNFWSVSFEFRATGERQGAVLKYWSKQ